jgi:hypothetical protein
MQEIVRRKNLDHKHIVNLKFQDNYKVSGIFKKKSLAYCFYFIPQDRLIDDVYGGNMGKFKPNNLEDLLITQVTLVNISVLYIYYAKVS